MIFLSAFQSYHHLSLQGIQKNVAVFAFEKQRPPYASCCKSNLVAHKVKCSRACKSQCICEERSLKMQKHLTDHVTLKIPRHETHGGLINPVFTVWQQKCLGCSGFMPELMVMVLQAWSTIQLIWAVHMLLDINHAVAVGSDIINAGKHTNALTPPPPFLTDVMVRLELSYFCPAHVYYSVWLRFECWSEFAA